MDRHKQITVLGRVGGEGYGGTAIAAINDGYCSMIIDLVWSGYHGERLVVWVLWIMRAIFSVMGVLRIELRKNANSGEAKTSIRMTLK